MLQKIFFTLLVKPVVYLLLGVNVRGRGRLPKSGPALIVANHNSHLDTLVLMSLVPPESLGLVRPLAAADYFLKYKPLAWFAKNVMNIIPVERRGRREGEDPLGEAANALERSEIVLIFPEGSRGEPEQLSQFKKGVAHLAKRFPEVPTVPIFMHGLGRALPRGEAVLVPVICDVFVGESLRYAGGVDQYMEDLSKRMQVLAANTHFPRWDKECDDG